jgi:hypothetical protein
MDECPACASAFEFGFHVVDAFVRVELISRRTHGVGLILVTEDAHVIRGGYTLVAYFYVRHSWASITSATARRSCSLVVVNMGSQVDALHAASWRTWT